MREGHPPARPRASSASAPPAGGSASGRSRPRTLSSPYRAGGRRSCCGSQLRLFSPEDRVGIIGPKRPSGKSSLLDLDRRRRQRRKAAASETCSTLQLASTSTKQERGFWSLAVAWTRKVDRVRPGRRPARSIFGGVQRQRIPSCFGSAFCSRPPAAQSDQQALGGEATALSLPRLLIPGPPNVLLLDEAHQHRMCNVTVLERFSPRIFSVAAWWWSSHDRLLPRSHHRPPVLVRGGACSSAFEGNYSAYLRQAGPAPSAGDLPKTGARSPKAASRRPQASPR